LLKDVGPEQGLQALDFAANRALALSPQVAAYRTVVFATHGWLDDDQPQLSGIVLSQVDAAGRPQDGLLRLDDIYNLKLNAELVVLAACETGMGKEVKGEGLVALARAFMYAGASRVLASLWNVDEEATVELVKRFVRNVEMGRSYPEALREAQAALAAQPRWRRPYYWAGFTLQGDWR
jgi:CHAT domain-containing protein